MSGAVAPVVRLAGVSERPLHVQQVLAAVADPGCGGVAAFLGVVRDEAEGRGVVELGYTAHPAAEAVLRAVAERVAVAHPAVRALAVLHRVGDLGVGEPAVVAAAAAPHRRDAFAACEELVDLLKREVPLWKHQRFADGTAEWVGAF